MTGLALPLLASLMKKSGHLTRNTSAPRHLAKCAGGCSCTVQRDFSGCRPCLEVAYGTRRNVDTATWAITGTPFVYENRQGGLPYVPLNGNSPSINGTYIVPCGVNQQWWHCAHVGTRTFGLPTPQYYFYSMLAWFRWSVSTQPYVEIWSGAFSNITGINPYPTIAMGGAPAINQNEATRVVQITNPGTLADWLYELGGSCTTDCNVPTLRNKCPAAYPALTAYAPTYQFPLDKHNHVEVADLTITCAVALV